MDSIRIRELRSRTTKKVGEVRYVLVLSSVADPGCFIPEPGCLSRIRTFSIPDPNFFPSPIPDPHKIISVL
jgi:hypothetical protein